MKRMASRGFTLIEIVLVIVLLSIVALGTTRYVVQATQQYTDSDRRSKLIAEARVMIEQITRQLTTALPNSVRVSASGSCVEFFPVLNATRLQNTLSLSPQSEIATASFDWDYSGTSYAAIAPMAPSELYKSYGNEEVISRTVFTSTGSLNTIPLLAEHTFVRNSISDRVFLVSTPKRFCLTSGGNLQLYSGYGINSSLGDSDPGGSSVAIGRDLDTSIMPFAYSAGSLMENAIVTIALGFDREGDQFQLQHEVHIRNVP